MQETQIPLYDKKVVQNGKNKGKERIQPWEQKKRKSRYLAFSYYRLGMTGKGVRVMRCGDRLEFDRIDVNTIKLHAAEFCRDRLCPMCAWRRSQKLFGQVSKIMDYMTERYDYKYIFLTFTVRNMEGRDLSEALDKLLGAFKLMIQRKEFKRISKGWFRALEVTHNWERDDYHPHIHMIVAVNKSYFDGGRGGYMTHDAWMKLWQSCADLDYDPWVDVRKVRPDDEQANDGGITYGGAVAEIAKYAVKDNDYVLDQRSLLRSLGLSELDNGKNAKELKKWCEEQTDKSVLVMHTALSGRRLISFGGKLKEVHKLLNLDDPLDGDLVNTDNEDKLRDDVKRMREIYEWNAVYSNYFLATLMVMETINREEEAV